MIVLKAISRMLCLVLLATLATGPGLAAAEQTTDVRPGLMWNRTGLPAVFPLQVRTAVGKDYYLHLSDAETGAPALAAFIEGGRYFRVLVPPGRFTVRFAYGRGWQGEEDLFGAESGLLELEEPLEFAVTGFARKSGHVIDITSLVPRVEARLDRMEICQSFRLNALRGGSGVADATVPRRAWMPEPPPVIPRKKEKTVEERQILRAGEAPDPRRAERFVDALPVYDLRDRPC